MLTELVDKFKTDPTSKKLGTFGGVFTPDVLTILGVIMFLRLGWVVGNAGLLGAIAIIVLAKVITICTGLSMSSITTNIKIGPGGAYSIISKSLGLEAGGSVGIPFYVSQTLSVALYVIGFVEGWKFIFPGHSALIIMLATWAAVLTISYISAAFAIRVQYIILVIIILAIFSFVLSPVEPTHRFQLIGQFEDGSFWEVFAVFFPAVTGIMAGANLSGDLKNPRKAIPLGTMSAIVVTLIIYIGLAWYNASFFNPLELRTNQMIMVENAYIESFVLMGILAATFSSALSSLVGAPRILQALAEQKTVPFHKFFEKKIHGTEPRNAIIFTSLIVLAALLLIGNLNALATLITMFFLITYGMLNLVVFIQQSMKIISFRPTFKIPRIVAFLGAVGCIFVMFLINPIFSIVAIVTIISLYVWLGKKGLEAEWGDIRGGMFLVLAEMASRIAAKFPRHQIAWKPDILLPIENPKIWAGSLLFIKNITFPSGSIFAFTVRNQNLPETRKDLKQLLAPLDSDGILVNSAVLEDNSFLHGAKLVIETLQGGAFRPNILFLTIGNDEQNDKMINELVQHASEHELGAILLKQHPRNAFGLQRTINVWLRDKSPNWHLAILITLQLQLNWEGRINLVTVAENDEDEPNLKIFLNRLSDQARLPSLTEFHVVKGGFKDALTKAPRADISIFGIGDELPFSFIREITELTNSSCLFVKDSGHESAIA